MDFVESEGQKAVRKVAREFAENTMRPVVMRYDESQEFPHAVIRELASLGFMGMTWPEDLEGAGLSDLEAVVVIEELARVDPSIALTVASHNSLCSAHIMLYGNEEQRHAYIPELASGRALGAWALTEPASGSDSSAMVTTAVRKGSDWVLNGSKCFITQGSVASTYVVMATSDPSAGKRGIATFILEKGMKGLSVGKKENKLGMRSSDTATLMLDAVAVPARNLIGSPGDGFRQALRVLDGGTCRDCGSLGWDCAGGARCESGVRNRQKAIREAHQRASGHPVEACRHGNRDRGRTASDTPCRLEKVAR